MHYLKIEKASDGKRVKAAGWCGWDLYSQAWNEEMWCQSSMDHPPYSEDTNFGLPCGCADEKNNIWVAYYCVLPFSEDWGSNTIGEAIERWRKNKRLESDTKRQDGPIAGNPDITVCLIAGSISLCIYVFFLFRSRGLVWASTIGFNISNARRLLVGWICCTGTTCAGGNNRSRQRLLPYGPIASACRTSKSNTWIALQTKVKPSPDLPA